MIDPDADAFRRQLRSRTRPAVGTDDEDWKPHRSWSDGLEPEQRRKTGPPPQKDPSAGALAARRYRERRRQQQEQGCPMG